MAHVTCASCWSGSYRVWEQDQRGAWVYVTKRCEECLGMGRVPRNHPRLEGVIIVGNESTTSLAIVDAPITMRTLQLLAKTTTVPERWRGKPADMMAAVLVGRELNVHPMESINSLYLVNGRTAMESKLMLALIFRAGHMVNVKLEVDKATVFGKRWHEPSGEFVDMGEITFTQEDAERAKLSKKDTYQLYPQDMLGWKAIARAARFWFTDVVSGVNYLPQEIEVIDEYDPIPVDVLVEDDDEGTDE